MNLILVGWDQRAAQFVEAYTAAGGRISAYLDGLGASGGSITPLVEGARPLDDIEAVASLPADGVLLAGDLAGREGRFKALLRLAPADMAVVLPLADKPDPLYELALMEGEARFQVVPLREEWPHPAPARLRALTTRAEFGPLRWVEWSGPLEAVPGGGRFQDGWTWLADLVGEVATVSATGSQTADQVVVSARTAEGVLITLRLSQQDSPRRSLHLELAGGSALCELAEGFTGPALVTWRIGDRGGTESIAVESLGARWLAQWRARTPDLCKAWWGAATRAAEIAEAVETSLRRQRAVAVSAAAVSEESAFKSIMTAAGCGTLAAIAGLLALAAAGVPYVDLLALPLLGLFLLLQLMLLVVRRQR